MPPNTARACVKSVGMKSDNDQIFDMGNFDGSSRRIGWSKNCGAMNAKMFPRRLEVPCAGFFLAGSSSRDGSHRERFGSQRRKEKVPSANFKPFVGCPCFVFGSSRNVRRGGHALAPTVHVDS